MRASPCFALIFAGCLPLAAPEQAGRDRVAALLQDVVHAARGRDPQRLAALLTPACRRSCRGFVPFVLAERGGYQIAAWSERLQGASLIGDLLRALGSFARVEQLELRPIAVRRYGGRALFRARLRARGVDLEG